MGAERLAEMFWRVQRGCQGGDFGGGRLSWTQIESWARQTRNALEPWEVEGLVAIDDAHYTAVTKHQEEYPKKRPKKERNA